jgi:hypothetical protein
MDEGTALEPTILRILSEHHDIRFEPDSSQRQVELNLGEWSSKTIIVRGKVDAVLNGGFPVDVKAFTQDQIDQGIPDYYEWQQSVYALGMNREIYMMPIFNKSTWQIEEWSLDPRAAKYPLSSIRRRVFQVEGAFETGIMPNDCLADFACQYPYLHDAKLPDQLPNNTVEIARARIKLSEKIRTFEQARKALDDALSPKLNQDITYVLDGYTIVLYANPDRFDSKAAQRLLTDKGIDWEHEPDLWKPGRGSTIRMTPKKARKDASDG